MTCSLATFHESDGATIASADEQATLPASNLLLRTPFDRWRTLAASGQVTITYGAAFAVSQIVMLYTNATAACTIRVRAGTNTTTVTSAPDFDSGTLAHRPGSRDWSSFARNHFLLDLSASITKACWRIDVNQVSGATYYEAGRIGLLSPWRPSRGVDWGDRFSPVDLTTRRRSRNGTGHVVRGGLYREVELSLATQTESEFMVTAGDLRRRVESRVPLFYAKAPRALSLGAASTGGVTMYTDDDLMDQAVYAYLAAPFYTLSERAQLRRMRVQLEEVVHP